MKALLIAIGLWCAFWTGLGFVVVHCESPTPGRTVRGSVDGPLLLGPTIRVPTRTLGGTCWCQCSQNKECGCECY